MKRTIFITVIMLFALSSFSQETVKYKDNENSLIEFNISTNEYFVKVDKSQKSILQKSNLISNITEIYDNLVLIKSDFAIGKYENRISQLSKKLNYDTTQIEPVLVFKDGIRQVCNSEIIVKVADNTIIDKLFSDYTIELTPNKLVENQFTIKIANISTFGLLDLVSQLQNHSKIDFIEPNFIRFLKPHTNDPFFSSQWSINNQGYLGGTVDADMDVDDAWAISTGANIKVAVIDEGVDLTHPDLTANLLSGYDATGNNSNGAPSNDDAHGTACAGIIAAIGNNSTGIAGIAYNAKIIPVRIAYGDGSGGWVTDNNTLADGITWAYQNGADILSNSWGGGSSSTAINIAINNAVNNGRNGKGCLVLFSSGNHNTDVAYPATLPNVVAVGATNMFDERKSPATAYHDECWYGDCHGGSNFGADIDVVAPGVFVYTTDISGSAGYSSGDYKSNFNGTSSACPQVAGVAALILSLNSNFTQTQVREVLESTTDKVSGYNYSNTSGHTNGTWNNEVGYGRINAYSAVDLALNCAPPTSVSINVSVQPINCQYDAVIWASATSNVTNYNWNVTNGSIISQSNNEIIVKADCPPPNWNNPFYMHVSVTASNFCGSSSTSKSILVKNGGMINPKSISFNIFPNPTKDILNIEFDELNIENSSNSTSKEVLIYDKMMMTPLIYKKFDSNFTTINVSSLKSGVYILKIKVHDKIFKEIIIISNE